VDNFEWDDGWTMHFGLIGMDMATQVRRPRPSAALYGEIARGNQVTEEMLSKYMETGYEEGSKGEK
jgi:beta-glucosidase